MKIGLVVLSLLITGAAQSPRVPTVTRTVQFFGELERKLASADAVSKAQMLTDDFEERLCAEPGTPVPREAWLQKSAPSDTNLSQEAVHAFGDVAIYSALAESNEMIIDTWKRADGGWKLAVRYHCPATGRKPIENALPKRY